MTRPSFVVAAVPVLLSILSPCLPLTAEYSDGATVENDDELPWQPSLTLLRLLGQADAASTTTQNDSVAVSVYTRQAFAPSLDPLYRHDDAVNLRLASAMDVDSPVSSRASTTTADDDMMMDSMRRPAAASTQSRHADVTISSLRLMQQQQQQQRGDDDVRLQLDVSARSHVTSTHSNVTITSHQQVDDDDDNATTTTTVNQQGDGELLVRVDMGLVSGRGVGQDARVNRLTTTMINGALTTSMSSQRDHNPPPPPPLPLEFPPTSATQSQSDEQLSGFNTANSHGHLGLWPLRAATHNDGASAWNRQLHEDTTTLSSSSSPSSSSSVAAAHRGPTYVHNHRMTSHSVPVSPSGGRPQQDSSESVIMPGMRLHSLISSSAHCVSHTSVRLLMIPTTWLFTYCVAFL